MVYVISEDSSNYDSRAEKCKNILLCFLLCSVPVETLIMAIIPNIFGIHSWLFPVIIVLFSIYSLNSIIKHVGLKHIMFILILLLALICTWMFASSDFDTYYTVIARTVLFCIPAFFLTNSINDFDDSKKYLLIAAYVAFVAQVLNIFVLKVDFFGDEASYSQYQAYKSMPFCLIFISSLFNRFKVSNLIFSVLSFIIVFSFGARGPVVCIVIYIAIKSVMIVLKKGWVAILIVLVTALVMLQMMQNFDYIIKQLGNIFESLHLSTRLLNSMSNEVFLEDDARSMLFDISKGFIAQHPFGVGLINERLMIRDVVMPLDPSIGWYAHNIFLEFLLQFGLIFGGLMIIVLFGLIFRSVILNKDSGSRDILILFIGVGLLPLFFSGSYLDSTLFYAMLGLCVNISRRRKIQNGITAHDNASFGKVKV